MMVEKWKLSTREAEIQQKSSYLFRNDEGNLKRKKYMADCLQCELNFSLVT